MLLEHVDQGGGRREGGAAGAGDGDDGAAPRRARAAARGGRETPRRHDAAATAARHPTDAARASGAQVPAAACAFAVWAAAARARLVRRGRPPLPR
eukprot:7180881-Prymnesium_polylepis.1